MGEAKRRKKILKEDYGQKIPKLKPGSALFNNHVQRFSVAFREKLTEINQKFSSTQPTKVESENFKTWVKDYLSKYQKNDQEVLAIIIIDLVYKAFDSEDISPNSDLKLIKKYILTIIFVHKMLNSFLSEETAKNYTKSLKDFYDEIMEEFSEEGEAGEEEETAEIDSMIEEIRQDMAEFLELEDTHQSELYTSDVPEQINSDNE